MSKNVNESKSGPAVSSVRLKNIGRLPPSILPLLSSVHPSTHIAVVPQAHLNDADIKNGSLAEVGGVLTQVFSAERLLFRREPPIITLVSPELFTTILSPALLSPHRPRSPVLVTLSVIGSAPLQHSLATRAANLAQVLLRKREVRPGDILPLTKSLFLLVKSTVAHSKARVALTAAPCRVCVPSELCDWARWKWRPRVSFSMQLATLCASYPTLAIVSGPRIDVTNALDAGCVGRIVIDGFADPSSMQATFARAELSVPCLVTFRHGLTPAATKTLLSVLPRYTNTHSHLAIDRSRRGKVSVLVVTEDVNDLETSLRRKADVVLEIPATTDEDRKQLVRLAMPQISDSDCSQLLQATKGYSRQGTLGIAAVFRQAGFSACSKAKALSGNSAPIVDTGGTTWLDVGGLEAAKKQIADLIQPARRPRDVLLNSTRRVGVLLYGPPGTGKTLLARAVSNESGFTFMPVKGPELLDKYVGESEKNIRQIFQNAIASAPTIVFFDELDALAPSRQSESPGGEVLNRVVSQLASELDEIVTRSDVFVIAASNRPDLVDGALLRPGRLDKMVFVPLPSSRPEQATILRAQIRKFELASEIDLNDVLDSAPEPPRLSGADLYSLASAAWLNAAKRCIAKSENSNAADDGASISPAGRYVSSVLKRRVHLNGLFNQYRTMLANPAKAANGEAVHEQGACSSKPVVTVTQEDLQKAAASLKPSLSVEQLKQYEVLRERIEKGV